MTSSALLRHLDLAKFRLAQGWWAWPPERVLVMLGIMEMGMALVVVAAVGSSWVRGQLNEQWRMRWAG